MKITPQLIKFMMMTTSDSDGEALTAIRKANAILKEQQVNWQEVLMGIKPDQSFRVPPSKRRPEPDDYERAANSSRGFAGHKTRYDDAVEIEKMFETALHETRGRGVHGFVESIHEWWQDKGFLTEAQYLALKKLI